MRAAVIECPISDLKLDALGVSPRDDARADRDAVAFATGDGITVAFFGVDGTRADPTSSSRPTAAVEAGARRSSSSTRSASRRPRPSPTRRGARSTRPDVPVHFHGHNDFGLATAAAVAAVQAGRAWIHGTVNGMGERAGQREPARGRARARGALRDRDRPRPDEGARLAELVQELSGYALEPWKPLVGENLFTRESGAVASQFHDPPSIEPYSSELVGADARDRARQEERPRLDPDQGRGARARRARGARPDLLAAVKELGARKRRLVTDAEFRAPRRRGPLTDMSRKRDTRAGVLTRAVKERGTMKFSLYSEMQGWPPKPPAQQYGETLEQIVNADRLGFDAYAVVEHFFFPKFSISADPLALFAAAAQRTRGSSSGRSCTCCRTTTRPCWPRGSAVARHPPRRPLRVRRRPRPRLDPPEGRRAARRRRGSATRSRVEILFDALENERFSHDGHSSRSTDSHIVPPPGPPVPRLPRRHERPHVRARRRSAAGRGRAAAAPVRGARAAARPLPRARAPSTATSPTSSGSTPATSTRTARPRCARPSRG